MIYQSSAIKERIRIADGIITMAVNEINPKCVDEFIALGHHAEGYNEVERQLYRIRASNSDIKFLYVYKIEEDGCHVVFDLETVNVESSTPGEIQEFDESFEPYLDDLLAGRPIPPIISDDTYGHLLTIYKPVYDSMGHCTCYAGIDFSMDQLNDYGRTFIGKVIALFSGVVIFILALGLSFIENNIILPINTMAYCARNFAYDSEEAREQNIERIKSLEIKTHDEIEIKTALEVGAKIIGVNNRNLKNFSVDFTNNTSEKGLRQVKRKLAVSFMFKNSNRMKDYATILSYFETCYRHGISRYDAAKRLACGNPYTVEELSSINKTKEN